MVSNKIKHILIALALITVMLSAGGCSLLQTLTPPQTGDSTEPTNPNWTFPSDDSQPTIPLPQFADVVDQVKPAVVSVHTEKLYQDIFGRQHSQSSAGSGIIIDPEGYIVTNNHVVEDATNVEVVLDDSRTFSGSIVGTDAVADLAVIKVEAESLPHATLGKSSELRVGDWVIAIGNALGEGISATEGIISRLNVSITISSGSALHDLIQTTAAINPGNSGGPLVNMTGKVVGINSAKIAAVGVEGMGYAISIDSASPIIQDLIGGVSVAHPWLGVWLYTVTPSIATQYELSVDEGALITEVFPDSPAEAAGLKERDVIIQLQGEDIDSAEAVSRVILGCEVGQEIQIKVVRGETIKTVTAYLGQMPSQ